jgi:hypothetical protein
MPRLYLPAFSILVVGLFAPLFSLPASAAMSPACKTIDNAYKKEIQEFGLPLRQEQDVDQGKGQKGYETLVFHYIK